MKEIPDMERPYEKCLRSGASGLSDAELLAVVLRTGSRGENVVELAKRLLYHSGGDGILGLHRFSVEQLVRIRGIGKVKAVQLVCILELARNLPQNPSLFHRRPPSQSIIWKICAMRARK